MNKLVYIMGLSCLAISCGGPAAEPETAGNPDTSSTAVVTETPEKPEILNSFNIEPGVVGVFKVGQPMPQLPNELSSRKAMISRPDDNGVPAEHLQHVIFSSLEDVAEVTMEYNPSMPDEDLVVTDVKVISNYYETSEGIKKGSTLTELLATYPDAKIRYNGKSGEIVAETPAYVSVQFVLDPSSCTKGCKGTKDITLSQSNFKEDAKITAIRVY